MSLLISDELIKASCFCKNGLFRVYYSIPHPDYQPWEMPAEMVSRLCAVRGRE